MWIFKLEEKEQEQIKTHERICFTVFGDITHKFWV